MNQSFKIEKASGKKSYLLSARELYITWADEPMYWSWKHVPESRLHLIFVQIVYVFRKINREIWLI